MLTVRTVAEMRAWPRTGSVGLVPTMGAFHDGHLSLIDAARAENDHVVVWLFVNPTQFNEAADLQSYPRDEARDAALAAAHGADVLFAPTPDDVYPPGFATTVTIAGLGDTLEGAHRPGHFAGVATVVAKMLNMVRPDRAYFGAKDAQQVALVRRLVADLDIGVDVVARPTVREPDGLALSSRNVHLDAEERRRATALSRGLQAAAASGEQDSASLERIVRLELERAGADTDYVALVDPETFAPLAARNGRPALLAVAARVGDTRLIDNTLLQEA